MLGLHQGLVDQPAEQIDDIQGRTAAHLLDGLQRHAAGEDGQAPEQDALVPIEQIVAPRQRGVQRLLAGDRGSAAAAQDPQRVAQPRRDLAGREGRGPGRREFEGQRHPVQADADLGHRRRGRLVEREVRGGVVRSLGEQPYRFQLRQPVEWWQGAQIGQGQRWRAPRHLPTYAQRLPAGGQHDHARAAAQHFRGQPRARVQQMFAVVQDQQQAAVRHLPGQRELGGFRAGNRHVQHRRHRVRDQLRPRQ